MNEAKEAADRHVAAFNAHDAEAHMANESPDIEWVMPGGITLRGPQAVVELQKIYWAAVPDMKVTPDNQVVAGSTVVTEGYMSGTQTGTLRTPQGDIPPSGNRIKLRYATIQRVENGLVASEHLYFDQLEFLTQIGPLPAATTN
ncbi:MAG TPA: nuclear transport factor 2 family protein [Actinomycetota bacterium]